MQCRALTVARRAPYLCAATYYIFAATSLAAFTAVVAARTVARPDRPPPLWAVGLVGSLLHLLSLLIGSLPLLGVESARSIFAIDFCTADVETPLYGTLMLTWLVLSLITLIGASCCAAPRGSVLPAAKATRNWLIVITIYFAVAWANNVIIVFVWLAQGAVAGTSAAGLYSTMAIFLHTNQLAMPLLFGWRLRALMNAALAGEATHAKVAPRSDELNPASVVASATPTVQTTPETAF